MTIRSILLVAVAAPAVGQATTSVDIPEAIVHEGLGESQVMQWQDYLCNHIGHRLTGSDNFTEACEWARAELEAMGLEARLEQWAEWKLVWNRGQWMGRMVEPDTVELQVATPAWSAPTRGQVRGELVAMPRGRRELQKLERKLERKGPFYLYGPRPSGRDPVQEAVRDWIRDGRVLGTVQSAKSTGVNDAKFDNQMRVFGNRHVALASWEKRPITPQIVVRDDHAAVLEKKLKGLRKVVVEFEIRNRFRKGPIALHNVVADLRGTDEPEEMVIVCAHLDSWHQATGATDNGTGVCSTLEAARILTAVGARPRRTIRFILWGGEEQGVLGSRRYVVQHRSEMHRVSCVFNHDSGTNWAQNITVTDAMWNDMRRVFAPISALPKPNPKHAGEVFDLKRARRLPPGGGGSDHASFRAVGVPAWPWGLVGERPYGYGWHSQWDTYDIVVPEYQAHNATVIALAAYGVANLPHLLSRDGVERAKPSGGLSAGLVVETALGIELDGLIVTEVSDGGLAGRAGVRAGDTIVQLFGEDLEQPVDAARILRENSGEPAVAITVERDGKHLGLFAER